MMKDGEERERSESELCVDVSMVTLDHPSRVLCVRVLY